MPQWYSSDANLIIIDDIFIHKSLFVNSSYLYLLILNAFFIFYFAETSMDPDVYGAYNKQQIESLTTDGDGEFKFYKIKPVHIMILMKCKKPS